MWELYKSLEDATLQMRGVVEQLEQEARDWLEEVEEEGLNTIPLDPHFPGQDPLGIVIQAMRSDLARLELAARELTGFLRTRLENPERSDPLQELRLRQEWNAAMGVCSWNVFLYSVVRQVMYQKPQPGSEPDSPESLKRARVRVLMVLGETIWESNDAFQERLKHIIGDLGFTGNDQ